MFCSPDRPGPQFDLISDALPFGGLWYLAVRDAIEYAKHYSRSHDVVINVYDASGKLIEVHGHKGDFKRTVIARARAESATAEGARKAREKGFLAERAALPDARRTKNRILSEILSSFSTFLYNST